MRWQQVVRKVINDRTAVRRLNKGTFCAAPEMPPSKFYYGADS